MSRQVILKRMSIDFFTVKQTCAINCGPPSDKKISGNAMQHFSTCNEVICCGVSPN